MLLTNLISARASRPAPMRANSAQYIGELGQSPASQPACLARLQRKCPARRPGGLPAGSLIELAPSKGAHANTLPPLLLFLCLRCHLIILFDQIPINRCAGQSMHDNKESSGPLAGWPADRKHSTGCACMEVCGARNKAGAPGVPGSRGEAGAASNLASDLGEANKRTWPPGERERERVEMSHARRESGQVGPI